MNNSLSTFPSEQLILSENAIGYLRTTSKWAKFLAILNFIFLGLLFLAALFMIIVGLFIENKTGGPFPLIFMGLLYLIIIGISIVPALYLFKFAINAEKMVALRDNLKTEIAFRYLMSYYRFMGILTIIILGIYLIAIIIGLIIGISSFAFLFK